MAYEKALLNVFKALSDQIINFLGQGNSYKRFFILCLFAFQRKAPLQALK